MSGVATLKARGVKRALEDMSVDNPAACSPGRFALRPAAAVFKRTRLSPSRAGSPARPPMLVGPSAAAAAGPARTPDHLAGLSKEELAALARHVPKRLKKVVDRVAAGQTAPGERLFSLADLREIVTSVVTEREQRLGEDFAKVLQEKLAEQFRDFSRFNEDYISRDMRTRDARDCSYLS